MKNYIILFFSICLFISCKETKYEYPDNLAPNSLENIRFVPLNGGGYFLYDIPKNEDFLYAKAQYQIDNGDVVSKTSSVYSDTLFIEGLGQVKEYEVKLSSFDRSNNESLPIVMKITPLYPNTEAVLSTIVAKPGFSSVIFDWKNTLQQNINIYISFNVDGKEIVKVVSSNIENDKFMIENLEERDYEFNAYVIDSYGNTSEVRSCGKVKPYKDYKLPKSEWKVVRDEFLPEGRKNAKLSHYEGRIEKLWDDEIDQNELLNLNYFHTGPQTYPFSYYIDLGKPIRASRFALWQRDWSGQYYGGENVKTTELWASNDLVNWEKLCIKTIIKPSDPIVAKNEARAGHHFIIYDEDPRFTKPFRYLEYRAIAPFSSGMTSGCTSELTIYGMENE